MTRRRTTPALLILALLASLLVAGPAAGSVAGTEPDDTRDRSARGPDSVTIQGRGYGHGRGLSQYGAQGAASLHGQTYKQILAFYYPGTSVGAARGKIRALITADTSKDVVVRGQDALRARRVVDGRTWDLPNAPRKWKLTRADGGRKTTLWKRTGTWQQVRTVRGEMEFLTGRGGSIALVKPGGITRYRGALRSAKSADGRDTVNIVPLEQYLRGVVPMEVPALWHPQAVQAQAVAARSYAVFERAHPRGAHFDVYDTTSSQVYGGASGEHPAATKAVKATAREVRTYGGTIAFTQFSSSNGGWTAAGAVPYQVAKEDPWDTWSGNPNNHWSVTLKAASIEKAYPAIGDFQSIQIPLRDGHGDWDGRAVQVQIVGAKTSTTIPADTFRTVFGLKSTWIKVG